MVTLLKTKQSLLLLCFLAISCTCLAQDIIILKDARKITAKVVRENMDNIRYKNFDDQDGQTYTVLKIQIASIQYQNGEVKTFDSKGSTTSGQNQGSTGRTQQPTGQTQNPNEHTQRSTEKSQSSDEHTQRSTGKSQRLEEPSQSYTGQSVDYTNQTQSYIEQTQQRQEKIRKFYLSLGGSAFLLGDSFFGGGYFTFGFMPSTRNLFIIDINTGTGESKTIDRYSYTSETIDSNGHIVNSETRNDGKVSYVYTSLEVMLMWNMVFDLSDKWKVHFGPTLGMLEISGSDSYSPTSYKGVDISGIPTPQPESKDAVIGGVFVGFQWSFAKRWFLDINDRVTGSSSIDFSGKRITVLGDNIWIDSKTFGSFGNRVGLALGWRF